MKTFKHLAAALLASLSLHALPAAALTQPPPYNCFPDEDAIGIDRSYRPAAQLVSMCDQVVTRTGVPCMQNVGPWCSVPSKEIAVPAAGFAPLKKRL